MIDVRSESRLEVGGPERHYRYEAAAVGWLEPRDRYRNRTISETFSPQTSVIVAHCRQRRGTSLLSSSAVYNSCCQMSGHFTAAAAGGRALAAYQIQTPMT